MKKRVIVAGFMLVAAIIGAGIYFQQKWAEETFLHAQKADDADDSVVASALFREACEEGSRRACEVISEMQSMAAD